MEEVVAVQYLLAVVVGVGDTKLCLVAAAVVVVQMNTLLSLVVGVV